MANGIPSLRFHKSISTRDEMTYRCLKINDKVVYKNNERESIKSSDFLITVVIIVIFH